MVASRQSLHTRSRGTSTGKAAEIVRFVRGDHPHPGERGLVHPGRSSETAASTIACRSIPSSATAQAWSAPSWLKPYVGRPPGGCRRARRSTTPLRAARGNSTRCVRRSTRPSAGNGVFGIGVPRPARAARTASLETGGSSVNGHGPQRTASKKSTGRTVLGSQPRVAQPLGLAERGALELADHRGKRPLRCAIHFRFALACDLRPGLFALSPGLRPGS